MLPPPAARDRVIQEVQQCIQVTRARTKLQGRDPLASCLMTAAGLLFLADSFKKKKKAQECWKSLHSMLEMPFVHLFDIQQLFTEWLLCAITGNVLNCFTSKLISLKI